ncbi:hypothetical protein HXX76_012417 [Chlamydomonas incerta]|uniref:Uncharacterized protein n=1 Tax=Chlamydomonas incerta TaxID=51695 RepID=A0A835VVY0_CHLIN|nr:hypothetical protein HXX76_012417 [Chlamydomonas incerta]|eukprot:KAG2427484.1 hypothetical protein HXX76_012417 [Chlamydomonas incerta]
MEACSAASTPAGTPTRRHAPVKARAMPKMLSALEKLSKICAALSELHLEACSAASTPAAGTPPGTPAGTPAGTPVKARATPKKLGALDKIQTRAAGITRAGFDMMRGKVVVSIMDAMSTRSAAIRLPSTYAVEKDCVRAMRRMAAPRALIMSFSKATISSGIIAPPPPPARGAPPPPPPPGPWRAREVMRMVANASCLASAMQALDEWTLLQVRPLGAMAAAAAAGVRC